MPDVRPGEIAVTAELLVTLGVEAAAARAWAPVLAEALARHGIRSGRQVAAFLANAVHETGGLRRFEESLNYSVEGLRRGFGRARISEAMLSALGRVDAPPAARRAADQRGIANAIYGGEWGLRNLGNSEPEDGWAFRGRGIFQLTGRANFERYGRTRGRSAEEALALLSEPATRDAAGADAACWFFTSRRIGPVAEADDIAEARRLINGGDKGLEEVTALYARAKAHLGVA